MAAQAVRWSGIRKVARSKLTQCSKSCDLQPALQCAICGAQGGTALCRVGGATSQLDLPSLTQLYIAGCGFTATRSSPLGYFSKLLQVVDN